jgi:hypothetical protein
VPTPQETLDKQSLARYTQAAIVSSREVIRSYSTSFGLATNLLAKPIDIEFHISFHKGMNQYVGLEQFVSWENCGVGRGNKLTEKEFSKLKPDEQSQCSEFEVAGEKFYFLPKKLGKAYIIRHNGDQVPIKEFFTPRLFTHEVLTELDEKTTQKNSERINPLKMEKPFLYGKMVIVNSTAMIQVSLLLVTIGKLNIKMGITYLLVQSILNAQDT